MRRGVLGIEAAEEVAGGWVLVRGCWCCWGRAGRGGKDLQRAVELVDGCHGDGWGGCWGGGGGGLEL